MYENVIGGFLEIALSLTQSSILRGVNCELSWPATTSQFKIPMNEFTNCLGVI